ncbi:MAG: VOC family protein [Cyanobacteriota bacterium]|nr:VOC family protein [Cyanobacteriota bacterium]
MTLPHIVSIGFTCADLAATTTFFCEGLGFRPLGDPLVLRGGPYGELLGLGGAVIHLQRLAIGTELLELTQVVDPGEGNRPGRPIPRDSRSNDHWFQHICLVVADLEGALEQLRGVRPADGRDAISTAPQRLPDWNEGAAGIVAYKFRDPEGHPLELLQFPPDKGDARWHAPAGSGPVLGIDHSAIGVSDSEASCRFYGGLLGLRLGGDGINHGPEQDHLDGLPGARVRITSHRCPEGAGMECLDYRVPAGGRPMPPDQGPQDAAHWQVRLQVADLAGMAARASDWGGRLVGAGPVDLGEQAALIGGRRALQLADPDGHHLQLIEA